MPEVAFAGILLRLALALGIIVLGLALFRGANLLVLARAKARAHVPGRRPADPGASGPSRPAAATLLYFTTPECGPCKTVQRPAIERLRQQMGDRLEVIEIDASLEPEAAVEWGVLSVPTTFVLDAAGAPRHVNHGVTTADKLMRQVEDVSKEIPLIYANHR
jgi:thiol-disulfide isomerase/thioredoxin